MLAEQASTQEVLANRLMLISMMSAPQLLLRLLVPWCRRVPSAKRLPSFRLLTR
jgi:hypothetical protein